jgi:archaemetzincin
VGKGNGPSCTLCALDGESGRCLTQIAGALREAYGIETDSVIMVLSLSRARNPSRDQYDALGVLAILDSVLPATVERALAITSQDLSTPVLSFVLGEADSGGRIAVISLHRLQGRFYGIPDDPAAFLDRAAKISIHEVGHLLGLTHCTAATCPMHPAASVEDLDLQAGTLCEDCERKSVQDRGRKHKLQ